jgi:hypothetical protein
MLAGGRGPFTDYQTAYAAAQTYANRAGREAGLRKSREFGKDIYTVHPLPNAANRYGDDLRMQVVPPTRIAPPASPGVPSAATADQHVGDASNIASAMSRFEAALSAGVPIADMLAAQNARLGPPPVTSGGSGMTFAQRQAQIGSPDANTAEALALLDTDPSAARAKFWDAWEGLPVGPSPRKDALMAAAKAAQRGDAEAARRALAAAG